MSARRPAKRPSKDDGERAAKKGNKEPTYDTYEDAFDGGVELEEKGERYKDGDKAQRFYERAAELYQKAMQFEETYDAMYNLGRVQYTLASQFLLPPSSLDIYGSAIALYRRAMQATENPFEKNDAAFNLAQTCVSLADLTEEVEGPSAAEGVKELRDAANFFMQQVFNVQFMTMQATGTSQQESAARDVAEGREPGTTETTGDEEEPEIDPSIKRVMETHALTPSSFCDTALEMVELQTTMWEAATPPVLPAESTIEAVNGILGVTGAYAPDGRQAELDLAQIKVLLTFDSINWQLARDTAKPDQGHEKGLEAAIRALKSLLANLDAQNSDQPNAVRADLLTTLADTEVSAAIRQIVLLKQLPAGPSPQAQAAWAHLTSATESLKQGVDLPATGLRKEFKPATYLELVRTSLLRVRLEGVNATAKANATQLLSNAAVYAQKAASHLGWGYPNLPNPAGTALPKPPLPLTPPYPGGWDIELISRNLALHMLRVCFFVHNGEVLAGTDLKGQYDEAATTIVEYLESVPPGPRRLGPRDIERFVGDVEDEEGKITEAESQWWAEIGAKLVASQASASGGLSAAEVFQGV